MLGKPVITIHNSTVEDYVIDHVSGFVIDKSADSLINAIDFLEDEGIYRRISVNSRTCFESEFSLYELGVKMGKQLEIDG